LYGEAEKERSKGGKKRVKFFPEAVLEYQREREEVQRRRRGGTKSKKRSVSPA
jgi:hypothetical protein